MLDIREHQDPSADVDLTRNTDRTNSKKSDYYQKKGEPSKLRLVNGPSAFENQKEEVKDEEKAENPWEQAANNEQT